MLAHALCFHRRTDEGVSDGYLEPHPVPHLQTRLWAGHGLSDCCHVAVDGEVEVIESWEKDQRTRVQVTMGTGPHAPDRAEIVWV